MYVELRQLIGKFRDSESGKIRRVAWNMDQLFLNGRQIATINRVPGAAVQLMAGVMLTTSERAAVYQAIADARGGVMPSKIGSPVQPDFELLDDEGELLIPATMEINDDE